jgi:serine/threonine-protein kinase SRPK3
MSPSRDDRKTYKAVKILTAKATKLSRKGLLHELEVLQAVSQVYPPPDPLPRLRDHFYTAGPHGEHLCLVHDGLSTDVHAFRLTSPKQNVALHIVQRITSDVVDALAILHAKNVVHTGVSTQGLTLTL